ncbi:MAG: hypothetical protein IPO28_04300 [Holophagaceae bacterium]|nr:hypothetical protein [Holophagaceae bacterium]
MGQFIFSFFGFTALAMRFVGGVLVLYRAISMLYGEDPREHKGRLSPLPPAPWAPPVCAAPWRHRHQVVNKLMGLILAAVAMQFLINGVKALHIEMQQATPAAVVSTK